MRKLLINGIAAAVIFFGSVLIITERYQEERTVAVEEGLGIFATALISLVAIGGLSYLITNFKALIYKQPFGTFAVLVYGLVVVVVSSLGYMWVESLQNAAQANLDVFLTNLRYHADTLRAVAGVALVGLVIALVEPSLQILQKKGTL